jgi:hypothetical protein
MGVGLPLAINDEPILIPARCEPKRNSPGSGFVPAETEVTCAPVIEVPGHEDFFGLRGLERQFDLNSPTVLSIICLVILPARSGHRHG